MKKDFLFFFFFFVFFFPVFPLLAQKHTKEMMGTVNHFNDNNTCSGEVTKIK